MKEQHYPNVWYAEQPKEPRDTWLTRELIMSGSMAISLIGVLGAIHLPEPWNYVIGLSFFFLPLVVLPACT